MTDEAGTETAQRARGPIKKSFTSSGGRAAIVLALSAGLIATVALPAYAQAPGSQETTYVADSSQSLQVANTVVSGTVQRASFSSSTNGEVKAEDAAIAAASALQSRQAAAATEAAFQARISNVKVNGTGSSALLSVATSLIGMTGDCTMIVEQSLRILGYTVGDIGPTGFGKFGTVFTDPSQVQPGDIMQRSGHVEIYAGNGVAVSGGIGGWSSGYIADSPANFSSFVRIG